MSARAPRRSFATPFVLTLVALPACTVQSSAPPPQGPTAAQTTETHDHRNEPTHTNPPRPADAPPDTTPVANPPRPAQPGNTGVNDQVKGTANPTATTVAQSQPNVTPTPASTGRGYRQWTVTRSGATCESMVKVRCPEGAMCNPPPPAKYTCPKFLEDKDRIDVIQNVEKGDCFVDYGEIKCPPGASCNPPRPQKVTCPK